ncbi:MAG: hypothetical protein M3478_03740 [Planctomycetota bacterium]|nr:hypothetical protein [Planctomycetota bacterium]
MPVYLFTYDAYRSWMPNHRRGFTLEGEGYQAPNSALANAYSDVAAYPPFEFDHDTQRFLIEVAQDVCTHRKWRLHAGATELTHIHALTSWRDDSRWEDVRGKIRNIMSWSCRSGTTPAVDRGSSRAPVGSMSSEKHISSICWRRTCRITAGGGGMNDVGGRSRVVDWTKPLPSGTGYACGRR